jgi:hypothetical protein
MPKTAGFAGADRKSDGRAVYGGVDGAFLNLSNEQH